VQQQIGCFNLQEPHSKRYPLPSALADGKNFAFNRQLKQTAKDSALNEVLED
jgi:hypothetical protein